MAYGHFVAHRAAPADRLILGNGRRPLRNPRQGVKTMMAIVGQVHFRTNFTTVENVDQEQDFQRHLRNNIRLLSKQVLFCRTVAQVVARYVEI